MNRDMSAAARPRRAIPRNVELGRIHQAKARLQMTDPDYRAMLWAQAQVHSSAELDAAGRQRVLAYLTSLNRSPRKPKKPPLTAAERKVWALWYELESIGRIAKPASTQARAAALRKFVKRQTGVDDLAFCSSDQLASLTESMKKWVKRLDHFAESI